MHILNFDDYIHLKKIIKDKFNIEIHLHDACAGQYFSLEQPNKKVKIFIEEYFKKQNLHAEFDKAGMSFSLT